MVEAEGFTTIQMPPLRDFAIMPNESISNNVIHVFSRVEVKIND